MRARSARHARASGRVPDARASVPARLRPAPTQRRRCSEPLLRGRTANYRRTAALRADVTADGTAAGSRPAAGSAAAARDATRGNTAGGSAAGRPPI